MVALEVADPQLLVVALHLKDPDVVVLDDREIRLALARQMDAEPLFGHRMAIFQTSPGHRIAGNPGRIGQQASHPGGILAGFAYPDEDVFTLAARCKPEIFIDHEVGGLGLEDAASSGRPVQIGKLFKHHCFTSKTTASVAIPSLRPVNPSCSVVVALTFTRFKSHCRSAASTAHMASIWGPSWVPGR